VQTVVAVGRYNINPSFIPLIDLKRLAIVSPSFVSIVKPTGPAQRVSQVSVRTSQWKWQKAHLEQLAIRIFSDYRNTATIANSYMMRFS
jgi:hypothetical protein